MMKQPAILFGLIAITLIISGCGPSKKSYTLSERRQIIDTMANQNLERLYIEKPTVRQEIAESAGYAVFSNANIHVIFVGGGGGHGVVIDKTTGRKIYMKVGSGGIGFGLGAKDYRQVANIIDAEPMISTTTEAVKDLVVGIGCRRGKSVEEIFTALTAVLAENNLSIERVRYLATAEVKADEAGLLAVAEKLNIPLRIISHERIRNCQHEFQHSSFVKQQVNLPAVAEPAALLAGWRTSLIVKKQARQG